MKQFHLFLTGTSHKGVLHSYAETQEAIAKEAEYIYTTQVILCTTRLFAKGYRIFVHDSFNTREITLGNSYGTSREIRMGHNLPNLILAGEFDNQEVAE